jgi:NaMN:DMB phosphoribosyltransferase
MIEVIRGKKDFIESLRGKKATFMLALSTTKTIEIEGITQAGIPGFIHLTPTLDAEFVCVGDVRSIPNLAQTPKGVPTPALLTRATHLLHPFGNIELLDLGIFHLLEY